MKVKPGRWYKTSDGLVFTIGQNTKEKYTNKHKLFLTDWIIDGEYIVSDGIYRSLPEEGITEATSREVWRAFKQVNDNLVTFKKKYLEVAHYVSTVQHALQFSEVEPVKKESHESIH